MRIQCAGLSDTGLVRSENQDAIYMSPAEQITSGAYKVFALADGMGGMAGGRIASQTALEAFVPCLDEGLGPLEDRDALVQAFETASRAIAKKALDNPELQGMGTTLVALVLRKNRALAANVGDSRFYHFHNGQLSQISLDHNLVAERAREGYLTEQEAKTHPLRGVLTRALGSQPEVEVDLFEIEPQPGDILLLCSDGLHGVVEDQEISQALQSGQSMDQKVRELIDRSKAKGAPDNVSLILVEILPDNGT